MGKPKDPDYWKKWRVRHPEYRERERQRSRRRQRGDRTAEYRARAASRRAIREAVAAIPDAIDIDPMIVEARRYVARYIKRDRRDRVYKDGYEEAVAEVLLAVVEGRPMHSGLNRHRRREKAWYEHNWTGRPLGVLVDV